MDIVNEAVIDNLSKYLIKLETYINNINLIYAHTNLENRTNETLIEHSKLTFDKFIQNNIAYGTVYKVILLIRDIITNVFKTKDIEIIIEFILKAFLNAIYMHDVGKINPLYQINKLSNKDIEKIIKQNNLKEAKTDNHSIFSAIIYLDIMAKEFNRILEEKNVNISKNDKVYVYYFIYIFSYTISRHHSGLISVENYTETLTHHFCKQTFENNWESKCKEELRELIFYKENINGFEIIRRSLFNKKILITVSNRLEEEKAKVMLLTKLLYSLIVSSDSLATSEYINEIEYSIKSLNANTIIENYKRNDLYNTIKAKTAKKLTDDTMDNLRCKLFNEVDKNIKIHHSESIFYICGPTGIGKTNIATNCAINLIELSKNTQVPLNRIIYTSPFNTITNQVSKALSELVSSNADTEIVQVLSNTEVQSSLDNNDDISLLNYQMLNYPITLISHVRLFNILFGTDRKECNPLSQILNSVIIVDEIHSYKLEEIGSRMIELFDVYAKYLNIKFIIMSATLPKLNRFLSGNINSKYINLTENCDEYFKSHFFKNRVKKLDFSLLNEALMKERREVTNSYK